MKRLTLLAVIACCMVLKVDAQPEDTLQTIYINHTGIEKAYIHFDKSYYVAGETVWFKAYFFQNGLPASSSSNFYLQFTDESGRLVTNKHYPVQGSSAWGHIDLPVNLDQGYYRVLAGTASMLNKNNIYSKYIFVFNPSSKAGPKLRPAKQNGVDIKFFPESGTLIEGIHTRIAFKVTDLNGRPIHIGGEIKTDEGNTLTNFETSSDGYGRFQIQPTNGRKYYAVVEGYKDQFWLPLIQSSGINLKTEKEKQGIKFILSRSPKGGERYRFLHLMAEINGIVVFENNIDFESAFSVIGHLVTDSLPPGLLHIKVGDDNSNLLAERVVFINWNKKEESGRLIVNKPGFTPKEENVLEVEFDEAIGRSISVSVTDMPENNFVQNDNIQSAFFLEGGLEEVIHDPGYYFQLKDDSLAETLDNLLIAYGCKKNDGQPEQEQPAITNFSDDFLISVKGQVFHQKDKKVVEGGKLSFYLAAEDSSLFAYDIPVSDSGSFILDSLLIVGKTKFYYTYYDKDGKNRKVDIRSEEGSLSQHLGKLFSSIRSKPLLIYPGSKDGLDSPQRYGYITADNPEAKLLENVTVSSGYKRAVDIVNEQYASFVFRTSGKVVIDNITTKPTNPSLSAFDLVKNRITNIDTQAGKFVNKRNFSLMDGNKGEQKAAIDDSFSENDGPPRRTLTYQSFDQFGMRFWEVGLFINEMPANLIQLRSLRADQVALVKFYEAGFLGSGGTYPGGAVAVYINYSSKTNMPEKTPSSFIYDGFTLIKDFSTPAQNSSIKDVRCILYWNPNLSGDKVSKSYQFRFFNNDISKRFRVVVEGFDELGRLIHIDRIIGN